MLAFLMHWYKYVEIYAVVLTTITVPLGLLSVYLFGRNHFGVFSKPGLSDIE